MAIIKVIRTIVYEGDPEWVKLVKLVLAKSACQLGQRLSCGGGNQIYVQHDEVVVEHFSVANKVGTELPYPEDRDGA